MPQVISTDITWLNAQRSLHISPGILVISPPRLSFSLRNDSARMMRRHGAGSQK